MDTLITAAPAVALSPHEQRLADLRKKQERLLSTIEIEMAFARSLARDAQKMSMDPTADPDDRQDLFRHMDEQKQKLAALVADKQALAAEIAQEEQMQISSPETTANDADLFKWPNEGLPAEISGALSAPDLSSSSPGQAEIALSQNDHSHVISNSSDPNFCGSGGCTWEIKDSANQRVLLEGMGAVHKASTGTAGYYDLLIEEKYLLLLYRFNGESYISAQCYARSNGLGSRAISQSCQSQKPAISDAELKRLKASRQYDLDLIAAVQAVLSAPSPNDAVTAYCAFTIQQTEALTQTANSVPDGSWYEKQNIGVCRARILTGANRMPSPDQFREYLAKAQRDLTDIDKKFTDAGIALETAAEPTSR